LAARKHDASSVAAVQGAETFFLVVMVEPFIFRFTHYTTKVLKAQEPTSLES
jgi:hypothetical protein